MKHHIKTKYCDKLVSFKWGKYRSGQTALELVSEDGEPMMTVTSNMPGHDVPEGCIVIKDYSENEGIRAELVRVGVVSAQPTGSIRSGFVTMFVHRLLVDPTTGEKLEKPALTAPSPGVDKVAKIIQKRDDLSYEEAREIVEDCAASLRAIASDEDKPRFLALEEMTEQIECDLGLEPDYLDELLFEQL